MARRGDLSCVVWSVIADEHVNFVCVLNSTTVGPTLGSASAGASPGPTGYQRGEPLARWPRVGRYSGKIECLGQVGKGQRGMIWNETNQKKKIV